MGPRRLRQRLAAAPRKATATFSCGIPISHPRTSLRSHSGSVPKISSPEPPGSTKKKKKQRKPPNQTVRAPPASTEADSNPSCPPPRPHPPPGRSGTRPGSLGAPSAVGAAIFHRAAPVLPIKIELLVPACWSAREVWVWRAVLVACSNVRASHRVTWELHYIALQCISYVAPPM